jgi:hypothetical protein|tara:strand:+ start:329 stop:514 length:186 start_codon:yes stop_codon:yes gene_type:complete
MLSTNYRNRIIDICCRIISTDGEVDLDERIWMNKLCESNVKAKELASAMLCPDVMGEVIYK